MAYNLVSLILDLTDGTGALIGHGSVKLTPSVQLTDASDNLLVIESPVWTDLSPVASPKLSLLATDNANLLPSGWAWTISFPGVPGNPSNYNFFLPAGPQTFTATDASPAVFTGSGSGYLNNTGVQLSGGSLPAPFVSGVTYWTVNGSGSAFELAATAGGTPIGSTSTGSGSVIAVSSYLSSLTPVSSVTTMVAYMPLPSGTATAGQVPVATGAGEAAAWGNAPVDWLNVVTRFGADPTGTADSTTAIQAALNAAPPGGTVYLPAGTYKTTAPLVIPPQVTLRGPGSWHLDTSTCEILPASGFSGAAIILMYDQATGGYSVVSSSQAILNLILNGSNLTGSVDGIQSQGVVHGVIIQDTQIYKPPAHGIACVSNGSGVAYSWRGTRVSANTCGTHGFSVAITDCTWYDLEAIGCAQNGFNLSGAPSNSHFANCRAEYNSNGFALSGAWATGTGSGGVLFTGCSTDGNVQDGVHLAATGSVPVTFEGLMCRRDGANGTSGGGGYGGVRAVGHTLPTQVNGLSVFPGIAQTGGANSPEYGIAFTSSSANIAVGDGAVIYAQTTPWYDDGSNTGISRGANVLERTGSTSSYTTALYGLQASHADVTFTNPSTGAVTDLLAVNGTWLPSDSGWLAWNFDPAIIGSGATPSSGQVQASRINVRTTLTVTNVILFQAVAGTGLVTGNYAGLFTSSGTEVGITADQTTAWGTGTDAFKTMALASGPFNITAGIYWVLWLSNYSGGTLPQWGRAQANNAGSSNPNVGAGSARWATGAATQTVLPAGGFTPSSYFTTSATQYFAGLS